MGFNFQESALKSCKMGKFKSSLHIFWEQSLSSRKVFLINNYSITERKKLENVKLCLYGQTENGEM